MTVNTIVRMPYDDGAGGTLLYGRVTAAGPKAVTIIWESGLRNRVRREYFKTHGIVELSAGEWSPFEGA